MEHETAARLLCGFDSPLSPEEVRALEDYEEARQKTEARHPGEVGVHIGVHVANDGQIFLAEVSRERAIWGARFFEHVAVQSAEGGGRAFELPGAAMRLAARFCCRAVGFRQPDTVNFVNRAAVCLELEGKLSEALPLYRFVLEYYDNVLGNKHPKTAFGVMNLADCLVSLDQHDEALPLRKRQLELFRALPGDDTTYLEASLVDLAACMSKHDLIDEELALRRELLERRASHLDDRNEATLDAIHNLGSCYLRARRPNEALELFRREAGGWETRDDTPSRGTLRATTAIGVCLMDLSRYLEATGFLGKAVTIAKAAGLTDDPVATKAEELRTESLRCWSEAPPRETNETDSPEYSACMQRYIQREFVEFLECALPMVDHRRVWSFTMMQAILISLQRGGEESRLRTLVAQLFAIGTDPWQRLLLCLILGLEESATVKAAAQDPSQLAQAHYYTGCRLLTIGRVEEARAEFEAAKSQEANNEEWLYSVFELGHPDLSIELADEAVRLSNGATWSEFRPAYNGDKVSEINGVPDSPFTVSEVTDQLVKYCIPRDQWAQVVDGLNECGKAFFTSHEFQGVPLQGGTRLEFSLRRARTVDGWIYIGNVGLPVTQVANQQRSEPSPERVFGTADGLPSASPSGLVAKDKQAWVSYPSGGLFRIDGETGKVEAIAEDGGRSHDGIVSLHLSHRFLWVGSELGVRRFDLERGNWNTYGFSVGSINAMREDGDSLWALSNSDLVHLDWPREELRAIPLYVRGEPRALAVADDEVWCGFDEGQVTVVRFDVRDETWSRMHTLPYVQSLLHAPVWEGKGDLWVGTANGVQLIDRTSGSTETFGLVDCGMINSIANVGGLMVFGTMNGLFGFDLLQMMITKRDTVQQLRFAGREVLHVSGGEEIVWASVSADEIACLPVQALRGH